LPPTPPSTNNSATTSATNLALATLENGYQDEQLPTLIKKLETLVKHRETQLAQQLLPQLLRQAEANNDKPAQAKLLYLQGRIYSQTAQFNAAIAIFKQTIAMAQTLNEPQLLLGPTIGLAKIYSLTDRNALAAEHAQRSLDLARLAQHQLYQIESLQVLALSQFLASKSSDSLLPLQQSIDLARAAHSTDYLIQGYNFMGIIHTERRAFSVAEKWFKQALNLANTVVDYQQQAFLKYTTNGYYARSQALAGKINKAADLYTLALTQAYAGRVEQLLALSQLKAGLSECYRLKGSKLQAEQTLVESQMLEEQAQEKCEVNNKFLSFAVNRKISQPCD
jgi:tetratricopeptide (TPR) repeat protein